MKIDPTSSGRVETQAERIILNRILSGEFPEGMRLPNTAELATQLAIGANSVQQALARLSALGYLERKTRIGTIVRRREEKSSNVIILVGPDLKREPHYMDRRLTICLENELIAAGYIPHTHDNLISILGQEDEASRSRVVSKLIRDFTMYDPVGVIESTMTLKRIVELSSQFERPSVSIKNPYLGGEISSDRGRFMKESLKRLAAAGRKRLLWILKTPGKLQDSHRIDEFWAALKSAGLECAHIVEINDQDAKRNPESVACERMKQVIRQNRALPPAKRADCALVDEDILMRAVSVALLSEQVQVPEELLLCSHTNEEIDLHYGVPVIRFENAISEIARQAVKLLTTRILREKEPRLPILVAGQIKDEVAQPATAAGV